MKVFPSNVEVSLALERRTTTRKDFFHLADHLIFLPEQRGLGIDLLINILLTSLNKSSVKNYAPYYVFHQL